MDSVLIELENVNFYYLNRSSRTLADINLKIYQGEYIVITGESGGGKSTLALILAGFIPHVIAGRLEGSVSHQGIPSNNLHISEISQLVGLVQQDPENQLVCPTVIDEIAFGPENLMINKFEIKEQIEYISNKLEMFHLLKRSTNRLSGGEKQKTAIASILAMNPKVLIFDEPSAFLDVPSIKNLIRILKELNKLQNMTIIVLEHRPELFRNSLTRTIELKDGRIIQDSNKELFIKSELQILEEEIKRLNDLKRHEKLDYILEIENINVYYQKFHILRNISFKIKKGYIYGIIGRNGAGKSTFLLTLANLISYNGNIFFKGVNLKNIPSHKLAKEIGIIFQNPNHQIFEKTVFDEVLFAPKNFKISESHEIADNLLQQAALEQYKQFSPFSLSYGEKRRLNLASVEVYEPEILLLDEPFIGQSYGNIKYILERIKLRKENQLTTIIVSHRISLLESFSDYLLLFKKGILKNWYSPKNKEEENK